MKSLLAQLNAMQRDCPQFQASLGLGLQSVIWFGDLKGLARQFHVSIEYGFPMTGQHNQYCRMPVVRVLRPALVPNWEAGEDSPLPHVYFEWPDIRLSPLCLFDPKAKEWDPTMLISQTTVGWTVRWLVAYEFWEMTGRWIGGGRHDDDEIKKGGDHAAWQRI